MALRFTALRVQHSPFHAIASNHLAYLGALSARGLADLAQAFKRFALKKTDLAVEAVEDTEVDWQRLAPG